MFKKLNINFKNKFIYIIFLCFIFIIIFYILNNQLKKLENFKNNENKYKINSFIILLPNNNERKHNVFKNINKIGKINYNIYDAVVGKTINMIEFKKNQKKFDNSWLKNEPKRKNQLGCYLSHKNIIEKIKDDKNYLDNYDYTIIFEDDLKILNKNLNKEIEKILDNLKKTNNDDFDIIFLGNLKNNHGKKIIDNIYEIDKNKKLWGTQAYLLNNNSLNKIYNNLNKIDKPIDEKYLDLFKKELLKGFIIYPILVSQNGFDSTINIYNKKFNNKFL